MHAELLKKVPEQPAHDSAPKFRLECNWNGNDLSKNIFENLFNIGQSIANPETNNFETSTALREFITALRALN